MPLSTHLRRQDILFQVRVNISYISVTLWISLLGGELDILIMSNRLESSSNVACNLTLQKRTEVAHTVAIVADLRDCRAQH